MVVDHRERVRIAGFQELGGCVQPLGILHVRKVKAEFRKKLRRGQAIFDEAVLHSGTTAVASISTRALGSTKALTPTSAIVGKFLPIVAFQASPIDFSEER